MRFRAIAVLASLLLVIGGAAFGGTADAADRALLIGIGKYPGLTIGGIPGQLDLQGPANDLVSMRALLSNVLEYAPDEIRTLADADATAARIVAEIETWLIDGTSPGDRVLLYFSGHGAQVLVPNSNGGQRLTSALIPADASIEISETITGEGVILGPQLGALLRQLSGRQVTVVADSCYSGSITKGAIQAEFLRGMRTITPRGPLELLGTIPDAALLSESKTSVRLLDFDTGGANPSDNIAVWSASTVAQITWDTPEGGLFTRSFVDGLANRKAAVDAGSGVSASQLLYYLRSAARSYCESQGGCRDGLTPELVASDAYRASQIVPYEPASPGEPPPVEPNGPDLVDLAVDVLGHTNDFALSADILPGVSIGLGEAIRIRVLSAEDGFLLILDTGPDGKLRRLFPNDYSSALNRQGQVAAGRPFTMPDESYPFVLEATDPGPGTLLVLVADSPFDMAELGAQPAFEPMNVPSRALVAIAADLQTPLLDPSPDIDNRARRWSLVRVNYSVSP